MYVKAGDAVVLISDGSGTGGGGGTVRAWRGQGIAVFSARGVRRDRFRAVESESEAESDERQTDEDTSTTTTSSSSHRSPSPIRVSPAPFSKRRHATTFRKWVGWISLVRIGLGLARFCLSALSDWGVVEDSVRVCDGGEA